jgi:hypothetical protein
LALLLASGACRRTAVAPDTDRGPATPDVAGAPERARTAEARFRAWGAGRFEVVSFRPVGERTRTVEDDFHARTLLYVVPFAAKVKLTTALVVAELSEATRSVGEPGWTPEQERDGVMLTLAFGPGRHAAADELEVTAAAVFEDLEPGWRFRAFDRAK